MATIKPITWATGYFVSEDGRVFSDRKKHGMKEKIANGIDPYAKVVLMVDGKPKSPIGVHRLVAEFFVPNPNNHPHVNHLDGNKRNNNASNLEWTTAFGNFQHARATGLFKAKLSDEQVFEIRKLKAEGVSHSKVAKLFGIDQSHVSLIWSGKRYGWLQNACVA